MIKALFRKQFSEVFSQFSRNRNGAQSTPKRGLIIFLVIFGILYLSLGFSFFMMSKEMLAGFTEKTFPLFYMTIGMIATAVGLLGSVFNAYSTIYEAKDTEMLLSLPIQPRRIVFVRVTTLYVMTLLYAGAVLLPAALAFLIYGHPTVLGGINAIFLFLPLTLFVEALTLGIAFIVAAIARKVKNKKTVVMVFSILITLLFYVIYFKAQNAVTYLTSLGEIPAAARYGLFFYYAMGRAAQGSPLGMLVAMATGVGAFALACFLLSKSFIKFTTSQKTASAKGKKGVVKSASRNLALLKREWKIFSGSPSYVMNCGFGLIFLIAVPIFLLVKMESMRQLIFSLAEIFPKTNGAAIAASLIMMTEGMTCITAPSISIEGKRIYLLRSLPISPTEVFRAKIGLHMAVVFPGTLFASVVVGIVTQANALCWIMLILVPALHTMFTACLGLCLNVSFPVLDWKDEMVAVKSGVSVLVSVFGTMVVTLALGGLYFALASFMADGFYLLILGVLYAIGDYVMLSWLKNTGTRKFEKLG